MKVKFQILFILFLAVPVFAQTKTRPILFDTYVDEHRDLAKLDAIIDEFARRLNRERTTTKGYIVENAARSNVTRKIYWSPEVSNRKEENINKIYLFSADRIVYLPGGISRNNGNFADYTITEFWLVPEGADAPPTNAENDGDYFAICTCPTLSIEGEELVFAAKQPSVFTAEIHGEGGENATFKWAVSDGIIVSGQGTGKINLDLSKAKHGNIIITVQIEIGSLCADCPETKAEKIITVN